MRLTSLCYIGAFQFLTPRPQHLGLCVTQQAHFEQHYLDFKIFILKNGQNVIKKSFLSKFVDILSKIANILEKTLKPFTKTLKPFTKTVKPLGKTLKP